MWYYIKKGKGSRVIVASKVEEKEAARVLEDGYFESAEMQEKKATKGEEEFEHYKNTETERAEAMDLKHLTKKQIESVYYEDRVRFKEI